MFAIYIKRAAEAFGITHTREIYEKAIEVLPNDGARCIVRITCSTGNLLPVPTLHRPPLSSPSPPHTYRDMCLRYAQLETKLGEVDRARGIYSHGSQMSDPRVSGFIPTIFLLNAGTFAFFSFRRINHTGRHGRSLRSAMATRTLSERC